MNQEIKLFLQWVRSKKRSLSEAKTELHQFVKIPKGSFLMRFCLGTNKLTLCSTLHRANKIISKLRHFLEKKLCIPVYYAIFYSHLLYGCLVWSYSKQDNIDCIRKLQKRCVRILSFSDFNGHTNALFFEFKLLKIVDIFVMQKIIFMFFIIFNL